MTTTNQTKNVSDMATSKNSPIAHPVLDVMPNGSVKRRLTVAALSAIDEAVKLVKENKFLTF